MLNRILGAPAAFLLVLLAGLCLTGCNDSSISAVGDLSVSAPSAEAGGSPAASGGSRGASGPVLQPSYATAGRPEYKIGAADVLKVTVFNVDQLNRTVQVSGNGTITMPLIGQVQAAGRTAQQVESEIARRLVARYLQSAQVTVFIDQYNSQKITVGGAVKKPGVYPVMGGMSLLEAIATAEGLDTVADGTNVIVFRTENGERYAGRFDLNQIKSRAVGDPLLQAGDVVMVDSSAVKTAIRDFSPAFNGFSSVATLASVIKW